MRTPAQSDPYTARSDARGVHIVHTTKFALLSTQNADRVPN
jgi:hypothetical protein